VLDEILGGQLTALAVYMSLLAVPERTPASNPSRATAGEQLFGSVGCGACHVASLPLASSIHLEPSDHNGGAGIQYDLLSEMEAPRPSRNSDGSVKVELWSDFKRHNMGPSLADSKKFKTIATTDFITTPLWGVATTAPYMHDSRAQTLRDAILAHDGEATISRANFQALSSDDQEKLIEFLGTLGRADE
jgi:CxxC motif-containing protein (DUF1111 family)